MAHDNSLETSFARLAINASPITRLPTELLSAIFTSVAPVRDASWDVLADEWTILPLVCKRWRDIAEPFLYHRIDIVETKENPSTVYRQMSVLLQTLDRRPELGSYVCKLALRIRTTETETWSTLTRIVARCCHVRNFTINADFGPHLALLVRTIPTLPLNDLTVAWYATRPSLNVIIQMAHIATLRWLSLEALDPQEYKSARAIWPSDDDDDDWCPPVDASSGITGLAFYGAELPLRIVERLVSWPSALSSLFLCNVRYSAYGVEYTASTVERMLRTQHASLKDLQLGILADPDVPDLSDFPALDSLSLSVWNTLKCIPASTAYRKLATPQLRELGMTFDMENDTYCEYTDFDTPEVAWMQDLLGRWKSEANANRLDEMWIEFQPVFPEGVKLAFWPYDRFEEAAVAARRLGVEMVYSTAVEDQDELENPPDQSWRW